MNEPGGERSWPAWLETLRPDDVTRARIRHAVREAAEPLLAARRPATIWEVAARWAGVAAPTAAAVALLFGWLALRTGGMDGGTYGTAAPPVAVEELVRPASGDGPPAVLTSVSAPSREGVLAATGYATEYDAGW